jgi:RHS repeat-associated protein
LTVQTDHLNTPRQLTDSTKKLVWNWAYSAFGENQPTSINASTTLNLRYPGQYYDAESKLHYNINRYYDPATGRYTQSDPIGLSGGINTYTYVAGNTVGKVDPSGLEVSVVFHISTNTLKITDINTKVVLTVSGVFTGGSTASGQLIYSGDSKQIPVDKGLYYLTDNVNTAGDQTWFSLLKVDGRIDDFYYNDDNNKRSGIRLHGGSTSHGCLTIPTNLPPNSAGVSGGSVWKQVQDFIRGSTSSKISFVQGSWPWNPVGSITKYGTVLVK